MTTGIIDKLSRTLCKGIKHCSENDAEPEIQVVLSNRRRTLIILVFIAFFIISVIFLKKHREIDIALLSGTERSITQQPEAEANHIGRPIKPEVVNEVYHVEKQLTSVARQISLDSHVVLFTMINAAYLPFAYSWLCNTKPMNTHRSVLIVTYDDKSKSKLNSDWPDINVISLDIGSLSGNQSYSQVGYIKITIKRIELIQLLLMANIDVFVFEVDCVWLANPLSGISFRERDDIIVNPVSNRHNKVFAAGFMWLRSTSRTRVIWQKLTYLMEELGKRIDVLNEKAVFQNYGTENEQKYLARLIENGYGNVTIKILPLEKYADGKWYQLNETERSKIHPVVINNNWIVGNKAKIRRAKKWYHWFVREDYTCEMELVNRTIH